MVATAIIGSGGLALIKTSEGRSLSAYRDAVGIPTICYGHTANVKMGMSRTPAQCDTILLNDVELHQRYIMQGNPLNCIDNAPLSLNQRDALTSFVFNVGPGKFCASLMAQYLRARKYDMAGAQFPRWQNAAGRPLKGLRARREKEWSLYRSEDRPEPSGSLSARATAAISIETK